MSRSWATDSRKGWRKLREIVLKRDGYCCQRCGASEVPLHVDHIVPKRLNGSDSLENLQTLCRDCNLSKGGRFFEQALTPPTLHGRFTPMNVSKSHD